MFDWSGYVKACVAALLTYGLRLGGLSLGRHIPTSGLPGALLKQLRGLVLVALVVPDVVDLGLPGLGGVTMVALA